MAVETAKPTLRLIQGGKEQAAAWEVFTALSRHQTAHPHLEDNSYYQEAMQEAHGYWATLFARDFG